MRVLRETELYYFWEVIETELRAWVENPFFGKCPNEPVYLLAEIIEAKAEHKHATVQIVGEYSRFNMPFSMVHCVHEYSPLYNRVMKIHGEPKGTV